MGTKILASYKRRGTAFKKPVKSTGHKSIKAVKNIHNAAHTKRGHNMGKVEMQTSMLPMVQILADKHFNVRSSMDENKTKALAADIERNGQLNPLIVMATDDDKHPYRLIAGYRRFAALEILKRKEAPCQVYTGDNTDALFVNLTENTQRENLTPFDIAQRCVLIKEECKISGEKIANRLGLSKPYVNNLIRNVESLHPKVLEAWAQESKAATTDNLNKTAALVKDEQLTTRVLKIDGEKWSWKEFFAGKRAEDPTEEKGGTGGKGEGEGKEGENGGQVAPQRLTMAEMELMAETIEANERPEVEELDDAFRKGVLAALMFAMGKTKTRAIGKVKLAKIEADAEKEAEAKKEKEKAAKAAAKAKEKAKEAAEKAKQAAKDAEEAEEAAEG